MYASLVGVVTAIKKFTHEENSIQDYQQLEVVV